MADIKLGPLGSETTLPKPCWQIGSAPDLPYNVEVSVDEAKMSDGSSRFNFAGENSGSFTIPWDGLTWSQVGAIMAVAKLRQLLSYINEYTDNVSHPVAVTSFGYSFKAGTATGTGKYTFSLTLKETKAP